jgi:hypothetical protein
MFSGFRTTTTTAAAILIAAPALAGMWDGNYAGRLVQQGSNAMSCSKVAHVQMNIQGDTLTYHHFSNATFTAHVGADGSFKDTQQNKFGSANAMTVNIVTSLVRSPARV